MFYGLVKILSYCAISSSSSSKCLLESRISNVVQYLLSGSSFLVREGKSVTGPTTVDQVMALVSLVTNTLPPVSYLRIHSFAEISQEVGSLLQKNGPLLDLLCPVLSLDQSCKATLLEEQSHLVDHTTADLLLPLLDIQHSSLPFDVKQQAIAALEKLVFFSSEECLLEAVVGVPVSSFVASLLGSSEMVLVIRGLKISACLLLKNEKIFKASFLKEGVVHALFQLNVDGDCCSQDRAERKLMQKLSNSLLSKYFLDRENSGFMSTCMI